MMVAATNHQILQAKVSINYSNGVLKWALTSHQCLVQPWIKSTEQNITKHRFQRAATTNVSQYQHHFLLLPLDGKVSVRHRGLEMAMGTRNPNIRWVLPDIRAGMWWLLHSLSWISPFGFFQLCSEFVAPPPIYKTKSHPPSTFEINFCTLCSLECVFNLCGTTTAILCDAILVAMGKLSHI